MTIQIMSVKAWLIDLDYTRFEKFHEVASRNTNCKLFFENHQLQLRVIRDEHMVPYDGVYTYCMYIGFDLDHNLYEIGNWGFESDEQMLQYLKNEKNIGVDVYIQNKIIAEIVKLTNPRRCSEGKGK